MRSDRLPPFIFKPIAFADTAATVYIHICIWRKGRYPTLGWSRQRTILSYRSARDVGSNAAGDMTGAHGTGCCNTPRVKNSCRPDGGP